MGFLNAKTLILFINLEELVPNRIFTVVDFFSGAGGMSCGFYFHPAFQIVGAIDAQRGKPSSGWGTLECNKTYETNIGVKPLEADIANLGHNSFKKYLAKQTKRKTVDVLISCAPCTGFSRTIRRNLVEDDPRNSLVTKSADFVEWLKPKIFLMENVGELIQGKFNSYYLELSRKLQSLGYKIEGAIHSLDRFGLPQKRRRALVIAVKKSLDLHTLDDLWADYVINESVTHVRRAIYDLPPVEAGEAHPEDPMHASPNFSQKGLERLRLIPADGGSWPDLLNVEGGREYLIPSMERYVKQGRVGPHPDVYGRLAWDTPAVTLKRECSHTGNGRYAHPEQNRLCTVREMAILQGFPTTYNFSANSLSNMYRHIGDSVPPLISYQMAWLCQWILTGEKPDIESIILPNTHLTSDDIEKEAFKQLHLDGFQSLK